MAALCREVNIHNELVFGNLQRKKPLSGDAALQELYLRTVVADAISLPHGNLRHS